MPVVDYQRQALARAVGHVPTVKDVIVHKLIAWRLAQWDLAERWAEFDAVE